jgi:hypothetical protein
MAVVYRTTDRVTLKIDGITFKIAPLSYAQKMNIQAMLTKENGTNIENIADTTKQLIEYSIKDVDGLEYPDGEKFKLCFEEGKISEASIDELFNLELNPKLTVSLMQLLQGIPNEIVNSATGEKLEGVEIVKGKSVPTVK